MMTFIEDMTVVVLGALFQGAVVFLSRNCCGDDRRAPCSAASMIKGE